MYHTTTKSYTFKTRVITIFVHSAAAPRKQKQTDATGRDEPSKTKKPVTQDDKGCGEERQLLTRHEPVSHWLPTGHWHAPYPPACMYAICRALVRVAVYRERDAARRTVLLYTAFVILIIKRIKRKSQERNSRSTTRHAQECKEERRGITREGRSWTTFLFWREELNVTQDKSAHTNARKRRAHWNERNLGPAESPTQKKKMKKKSKKKTKKKGR